MATIREKAKKFHKFVRGLKPKHGQALLEPNAPLLDRFVFYLLLYSNSVASARKALKALTDDKTFASWSEVRVATAREIADILHEHKIRPADFLAKCLKDLLQRIFEEVDDTSFEPLIAKLAEAENAKARKAIGDNAKKWIGELPGIPRGARPTC